MIARTVLMVLMVAAELRAINNLTYRLSRDVIPQHYSLKLQPHMDNDTFHGEVTITVFTNNAQENFTLHSNGLNITYASLNQLPAEVTPEDQYERISVRLQEAEYIQPGEHRIHFQFEGQLHEVFGLNKKTYLDGSGKRFLVANEFEPTHARQAFPCFDEPAFKAPFSIRLVTPNDTYKALSNMPEIARYSTSQGIMYDFATSVKMSTYLVSLAITDYPYYEEVLQYNNRNLPVRVYTYNASKINNEFAIGAIKIGLEFFTDYTGVEYPLPKLDLIEYDKGKISATETWGLIQFKQGLLTTSHNQFDNMQRYVVLLHEIGHSWFGNLVTNDWWNDLWLQEATATFMSYKIMSKRGLIKQSQPFNKLSDLLNNVSPEMPQIVGYLKTTDNIEKRFNHMVYIQGPLLLTALEAIIGEQAFQRAIRSFMAKNAFGTATTNNLISEFAAQVPNIDIRSFLESNLYQPGYPVVKVDDSLGNYILSQIQKPDDVSYKWTIPISYSYGNNTTGLIWFDRELDNVQLDKPADQKWILFNTVQMPGIYAVNYTERMWTNLINNIKELTAAEVKNLGENLVMLYHLHHVNCELIFRLLNLQDDTITLTIFTSVVEVANDIVCLEPAYGVFLKYLEQNFRNINHFIFNTLTACDEVVRNGTKEISPHVRECAQWIDKHLKS